MSVEKQPEKQHNRHLPFSLLSHLAILCICALYYLLFLLTFFLQFPRWSVKFFSHTLTLNLSFHVLLVLFVGAKTIVIDDDLSTRQQRWAGKLNVK